MAPMTDEDRLRKAVERAFGNWWGRDNSEDTLVDFIRAAGITLTPPPAPEPVYPVTFPAELYWVARSLVETSKESSPREGELLDALADLLANATPEER